MPFVSGIGPVELIIILVIALIVVGPGRLPDVGAALGKSIREFRKAATDVKDATSIDPAKAEPAPTAPAAIVATTAAPVAPPPAPVVAPVAEAASSVEVEAGPVGDVVAPAPDIADLPEPAPAADEQPTPTA